MPVPGGPWKSTPRGGVMLKRSKTSGYSRGSETISLSCWTWEPSPPTESKETLEGTPRGSVSARAVRGSISEEREQEEKEREQEEKERRTSGDLAEAGWSSSAHRSSSGEHGCPTSEAGGGGGSV